MRMMTPLLALFLFACAGEADDKDPQETDVEETDAELTRLETIQALTGDLTNGQSIYEDANKGDCAGCHEETGTGGIGPDLTASLPTYAEEDAIAIILDGEGLMLAYDEILTDQEIADVVAYIYDAFGN